ncbi:MAG: c-type cytochrome [Oligoflexia bacterium]|nr:c-type cytochrome [Oligoflexia bacterium]
MSQKPENPGTHDAPLSGHSYDGIEEFDNSLPRWWLSLFYLSIAFAGGYFAYYQLGPGSTLVESYEKDRAARETAAAGKASAGPDGNLLLAAFKNPSEREKGRGVYQARCAACHGPQGQGLIGPNLADDHWLHGGTLVDIAKTVGNGVPDKGMPPWGPVISPQELLSVVAYVKGLKGTNPPNPKAPQGALFKE